MSKITNAQFKKSAFALNAADGLLAFLTITHPDLPEPWRLVNDDKAESVISRGMEFRGFPFLLTLPDVPEDSAPGPGRLVVDNVSREIGAIIRAIQTPANVLIEIIRIQRLDFVERTLPLMELNNITGNASQVEGDLTRERYEVEPFPAALMTVATLPGLSA